MVANLYDKQPALDVTRVHRARMYTGYILATRFERNTHLVVGHRKKIRFRLAIEILAASKFLEIRSWNFFFFLSACNDMPRDDGVCRGKCIIIDLPYYALE